MKQLTIIFCATLIVILSVCQTTAKVRTEGETFTSKEILAVSFHQDLIHASLQRDLLIPAGMVTFHVAAPSVRGVDYLQRVLFSFIRTQAP